MAHDINSILGVGDDSSPSAVASRRVPPAKLQYIQRIRAESAYPVFRSLVNLFAMLLYILGTLCILVGLILGFTLLAREGAAGIAVLFGGVITGLIYIIIGRVSKEASSMLADLADSITDLNSRYEQQQ